MKIIANMDKGDYSPEWIIFHREAVRAVIVRGDKIALAKSLTEGFFKFPGGGIEPGETHDETLIRETAEETGLRIIPESIRELGMICEKRKGIYESEEIFEQLSYYYLAEVSDELDQQSLQGYEIDLRYQLEWVDIAEAYETDMRLGQQPRAEFLLREAKVLKLLLDGRGE